MLRLRNAVTLLLTCHPYNSDLIRAEMCLRWAEARLALAYLEQARLRAIRSNDRVLASGCLSLVSDCRKLVARIEPETIC